MKAMSLRGQLGEVEAAIENGDTSCQNHVSGGQVPASVRTAD